MLDLASVARVAVGIATAFSPQTAALAPVMSLLGQLASEGRGATPEEAAAALQPLTEAHAAAQARLEEARKAVDDLGKIVDLVAPSVGQPAG